MGRTAAGALLTVAVLCMATAAHGQGLTAAERQAAAEAAYDRGSDAFRGGDYSAAARWYETANELAPSANALIQAIRSHERAGNDLRAGTLALDLVDRYDDGRVRSYAAPILERVAPTAVRVNVSCDGCELVIDGEAEDRRAFFLRPHTEHSVVARFETGRVDERVSGGPGTERDLSLVAPEPDVEPPDDATGSGGAGGSASTATGTGGSAGETTGGGGSAGGGADGGGLSPAFVVVGAGLTLAAGGVLVWSGLDTLSARDDYEQEPTRAKFDNGRDLELRTNILIGVTAGLGAVTIVLAALADWGGDDEHRTTAAFAPLPGGGGLVTARGTFR